MAKKAQSFQDLAALTGRALPAADVDEQSAGNLVYSTDGGRVKKSEKADPNACLGDGQVRVLRDRKGRGGKTVTRITGLPLTASELKKLCKQLKGMLGGGGAVKEADLELQGDHRDRLVVWLQEQGFKAKASGG